MKFLVTLTLCLCLGFTLAESEWDKVKSRLRAAKEACNSDDATKISEKTWEKIKGLEEIEKGQNAGAFTLCLAKKMMWLDDEGKVRKDFLTERITNNITDPEKQKHILETCVVDKDTPKASAINILKCLIKSHKDGNIK